MKATYIAKSPPFRDGWCNDGGFTEALVEASNEMAA